MCLQIGQYRIPSDSVIPFLNLVITISSAIFPKMDGPSAPNIHTQVVVQYRVYLCGGYSRDEGKMIRRKMGGSQS